MKLPHKIKRLVRRNKRLQQGIMALILVIVVAVGIHTLTGGRAISPYIAGEAETGTLADGATSGSDNTASGSGYAQFRNATPPSTPTNLKAFAGGASIAIRWSGSTAPGSSIKHYNIYRNGTLIRNLVPGWQPAFPEKDGNAFVDTSITKGVSYHYQVQAVNALNETSQLSGGVNATLSNSTSPQPTIIIDTSKASDLATWANDNILPLLDTWYPKMSDALAAPDYAPSSTFSIVFDPNYTAIAYVDTNRIVVNPEYARTHPKDLGMYVHEATHILQAYDWGAVPWWVTEGMADWTRDFMLHDRDPRAPSATSTYLNGYQTGAYFFNWIHENHDSNIIKKLNIASHNKSYSHDLFRQHTGKTVGQLRTQMTGRTTSSPGPLSFRNINGRCVDDKGSGTANGTIIQVWACNGTMAQDWVTMANSDGTVSINVFGKCMDINRSGTTNGTKVQLWDCNGTGAQKWQPQSNGTILNPASGKCMDGPDAATTYGNQIQIWDCNGTAAQVFNLPPQ